MRQYTIEELKARFARLGLLWLNFQVIGVRKPLKQHKPDTFEDLICIVWGADIYWFTCTTVPGVHWLQNLMNPKGTAIVVADKQYIDVYKIGVHKGKEALAQVGTLQVYRDANKNNIAEVVGSPIAAGPDCRIDIHGTGPSVVSVVIGQWSAGCQVLNNPVQFKEFMAICKRYGQPRITYTLLNEF